MSCLFSFGQNHLLVNSKLTCNSINNFQQQQNNNVDEENVKVTGIIGQIQHLKHSLQCNTSESSMV